MHAKRTLFNYGKIFVITRPLPSTIPIPTLFSHPPCLTLQPTTRLMITNSPTSSKRVLSWRGTQTRVSPPPFPFSCLPCSAMIDDETRRCAHGSPCSPSRPRIYTRETGSRSSQGQQEQEECC